jgi:hypothetical protein
MKIFKFLVFTICVVALTSCGSYKNLQTYLRYRGEYRVNKSSKENSNLAHTKENRLLKCKDKESALENNTIILEPVSASNSKETPTLLSIKIKGKHKRSENLKELDKAKSKKEIKKAFRKARKELKKEDDTDANAIITLIFGILSILTFWTVIFGIIFGLIAIIFGGISLSNLKKNGKSGKSIATVGLVLGIVSLLLSVLLVYLIILAAAA